MDDNNVRQVIDYWCIQWQFMALILGEKLRFKTLRFKTEVSIESGNQGLGILSDLSEPS